MKNINYNLYFVTPQTEDIAQLEDICLKAAQGGVDVIQLRYKKPQIRPFLDAAFRLKEICYKYHIPLIINDCIDVALAVKADGIHLGQSDMPIDIARQILGNEAIIGLSIESLEQIHDPKIQYANYVAISPVFATPSKVDTQTPLGFQGIAKASQHIHKPIIAIGGIKSEHIQDVFQHGGQGIAVISAISDAKDIIQSTQNLKQEISKWHSLKATDPAVF